MQHPASTTTPKLRSRRGYVPPQDPQFGQQQQQLAMMRLLLLLLLLPAGANVEHGLAAQGRVAVRYVRLLRFRQVPQLQLWHLPDAAAV